MHHLATTAGVVHIPLFGHPLAQARTVDLVAWLDAVFVQLVRRTGARTDVIPEVLELHPARMNGYASTAVPLVVRAIWIKAARLHLTPNPKHRQGFGRVFLAES